MSQETFIQNFDLIELIDPITYYSLAKREMIKYEVGKDRIIEKYVNPRLIYLFDKNVILSLLKIRKVFGITRINNWHKSKEYIESFNEDFQDIIKNLYYKNIDKVIDEAGKRFYIPATGKADSGHCFGMAFDATFEKLTAEEARVYIMKHQTDFMIKRLEADVNWLHFDTIETGQNNIIIFKP